MIEGEKKKREQERRIKRGRKERNRAIERMFLMFNSLKLGLRLLSKGHNYIIGILEWMSMYYKSLSILMSGSNTKNA